MQENEFEKRVQQNMGGFGIDPSDEVWVKVQKRIRKEKKRRFIFWWPFSFLLLTGAIATGLWFNYKKQQSEPGILNHDTNKVAKQVDLKENNPNTKTVITTKAPQGNKTKIKKSARAKNFVLADTKKKGMITTSSFIKQGSKAKNVTETSSQEKNITGVTGQSIVSPYPDKVKKNMHEKLMKQDEPQKIVENEKTKDKEIVKATEPVSGATDPEKEIIKQATDSINSQTKKKQLHKKLKKWDWGVDIAAGKSGFSNGLFSFNMALYSDAYAQQNQSGNPTGSLPSRNYPSFSWSAGLLAKKSISSMLDLNVGLAYAYFSTKINIGSRIDSTRNINNTYSDNVRVEKFYRLSATGSTSTYKNKYHFISLSANISWKIVNGKKIRLYWENGFSYNRLLGSSMLHFDAALPGYYQDNKLLTRNHLFFTTGFSIPVSQRILINPYAAYSLTPVLRNTNSTKTSFTNLGLQVKYLFKNKN